MGSFESSGIKVPLKDLISLFLKDVPIEQDTVKMQIRKSIIDFLNILLEILPI